MNSNGRLMHAKSKQEAKDELDKLLSGCFKEQPTTGAVVLLNTAHTTQLIVLNMDQQELLDTLARALDMVGELITPHEAPEILQ